MARRMTELDVLIIITLAEHNMSVSETAEALYYHRNTINYRIGKIRKLTGLDPCNFYDLVKLVVMAKRGQWSGG